MNKSALKNFATNARRELIKKVEAKALKIGITEERIKKAEIESSDAIYINGRQLTASEKKQREKLISRIREIGFKRVVEEVAYIWFNRFTALRFMEVNNYLPTKVRVLSSSNPENPDPDIIKEALTVDLDIDKELVYELKVNNKTEELFKYLIIKQCNSLNKYLPFIFEKIDDYTEILFPDGLLSKDSFLRQMTDTSIIPESDWQQVEIIGWLYQYYIAEEKDRVIKAKEKYKPEEIPYATQLFTPDWIVRYMVQNTLGRYWVEAHPEHRDLIKNWEFYLENPNPEPDLEEKLAPYVNKDLKVEDIRCFDPAMGSGHILVYMFDVLYEIYRRCGYMEREIPRLIIENNLYGLDIDDRAYQLACFSVVMKALEYNPRFLRSIERDGLKLNLASIQETQNINEEEIIYLVGENNGKHFIQTREFFEQFKNAKTLGSLIMLQEYDEEFIRSRFDQILTSPVDDIFKTETRQKLIELVPLLLKQANIMSMKYDILVTNPPYIGNKFLNNIFSNYIDENYPDVKSDLFSSFIEYSFTKVKENGHIGFMTPFVWMFIASYEKLRRKIISQKTISSLIQLEYSAFEEATVPICTFTLRNYFLDITGEYIRLSDFKGSESQPIKTLEAIKNPNVNYRYTVKSKNFERIPGSPIAYWASETILKIFETNKKLSNVAEPKVGLQTGDNDRFLRLWTEVDINKIGFGMRDTSQAKESKYKWFPYNKGGLFRKWYGNNEFIVNWENDGLEIKNFKDENGKFKSRPQNTQYYFQEAITWSKITSGKLSLRYVPHGYIFDVAGTSIFGDKDVIVYLLGLLNSKVSEVLIGQLSQTLNFEVGHLKSIPVIFERNNLIPKIVEDCIEISKNDWDSFETSWEFKRHPLLMQGTFRTIQQAYEKWSDFTERRFNELKENEEQLNRIFIEIYGLQNELIADIAEEDITIRKAERERDIKSFISYAVGCMFGRYSLDEEGVIYAGGKFIPERYQTFKADKDNILPILSGTYFENDIVSRFIEFVQVTFGEETLTENLEFIADTLGKKNGETAKETIRRYFLNEFYKDHVQTYKKRPIYWLFTSGKQKAFNCLIYMHRYDKTTLSRIRTDYVHPLQMRMDAERKSLLSIIEGNGTAREINNAKKQLKDLDKKIEELKEYEERLHHMADMQIEIDLDDGVAVNYEKFKGLLAKLE